MTQGALRVSPGVVLASGRLATPILERTSELIKARLGTASVPAIFQLVEMVGNDDRAREHKVSAAYATASRLTAAGEAEGLRLEVDAARVDTYIVGPLLADHVRDAVKLAEIARTATSATVPGLNAVFICASRVLDVTRASLHEAAEILDRTMQANATFNRCFFVDEVDEIGRPLPDDDDLVDVVARFLALGLASELSDELRRSVPPYIGEGEGHEAYAGFSCSVITFDAPWLSDHLATRLAKTLAVSLFANRPPPVATAPDDHDWFRRSIDAMLGPGAAPAPQPATDIKRDPSFVAAVRGLVDQATDVMRALDFNGHRYRALFDAVLGRALAPLEALQAKTAELRARMADLEIKIIAGIDVSFRRPNPSRRRPTPWLSIASAAVAVVSVAGGAWGMLHGDVHFGGLGAALAVAFSAAAWYLYPPPAPPPETVEQPLSWEELLTQARAEFDRLQRVLDVHAALYLRLDMACLALDAVEGGTPSEAPKPRRGICELDLLDEDVVEEIHRRAENQVVHGFEESEEAKMFPDTLFAFPAGDPFDALRRYCARRLDAVERHTLESIAALKNVVAHPPVLPPPFWHPLPHAATQRVVVASLPPGGSDVLESIVRGLFRGQRLRFVPGASTTSIDVVQLGYRIKLADLTLGASRAENPPQPTDA